MTRELTSCSEALKHVQHVLVEYMHPLLDLVYCGFFCWVGLFGFCLLLFKYTNILSHSFFCLLGEAPLSLASDSDLKFACTDELFCPDASLCQILSLNLYLGCSSSYLRCS